MRAMIQWDEDERVDLANKVTSILTNNPGLTLVLALKRAQDSLKPDRRRKITTATQVPWLSGLIEKNFAILKEDARRCKDAERSAEAAREAVEKVQVTLPSPQKVLDSADLADLGRALLSRLFGKLDEILAIQQQTQLFALKLMSLLGESHKGLESGHSSKPTFVIIGARQQYIPTVQEMFEPYFKLKFYTSDHNLTQISKIADRYFLLTDHISHNWEDVVPDDRKVRVVGTQSGLIESMKVTAQQCFNITVS